MFQKLLVHSMGWKHMERYNSRFSTLQARTSFQRKSINEKQLQCAVMLNWSISTSSAKTQNTHICWALPSVIIALQIGNNHWKTPSRHSLAHNNKIEIKITFLNSFTFLLLHIMSTLVCNYINMVSEAPPIVPHEQEKCCILSTCMCIRFWAWYWYRAV